MLRGNEQVASLLLVVFAGIGHGSLLCEVLRRPIEIGLVPLGRLA